MAQAGDPIEPPKMAPGAALAYAVGLPAGLLAMIFLPAGRLNWAAGWIFVAVLVVAFGISAAVLAKVNPAIYRARSRFQPGTKGWDKAIVGVMLTLMVAILPVAALDAGRFHWSVVPAWFAVAGYGALLGGIGGTAWAQAVNPFFEPGVRIQTERHQRVIDTGPYRYVRHPGYVAAILMFFGMALALRSWWALLPAALATILLVVRTKWEDDLLKRELAGYTAYAQRVRARLVPGLW